MTFAAAASLVLIIYVLSVGPAYWAINAAPGNAGESIAWLVYWPYFPLRLLAEDCQPFGDFLEWYTLLF